MISKINSRNYLVMKDNISLLSTDYLQVPSTNFLSFLNNFESDDTSWIDEINDEINKIR